MKHYFFFILFGQLSTPANCHCPAGLWLSSHCSHFPSFPHFPHIFLHFPAPATPCHLLQLTLNAQTRQISHRLYPSAIHLHGPHAIAIRTYIHIYILYMPYRGYSWSRKDRAKSANCRPTITQHVSVFVQN